MKASHSEKVTTQKTDRNSRNNIYGNWKNQSHRSLEVELHFNDKSSKEHVTAKML